MSSVTATAQVVPNYGARQNPAMAHLYIVNPLTGAQMDNLFATHPSTENRIAALNRIASEMRGAPRGPWSGGASADMATASAVAGEPTRAGWRLPSTAFVPADDHPRGPWG